MERSTILNLIDLSDPNIFGNEAAEDEEPEVLNSYFVKKPEFDTFENIKIPFSVVRARKGVGKSALLSHVSYMLRKDSTSLVISIIGSDLVCQKPFISGNPNELLHDWQQRICHRINVELGRDIGFAIGDTEISMIEASELSGFRNRNIVSCLLDRFKIKFGDFEVKDIKDEYHNSHQLLQRYMQNIQTQKTVCLFIDDIDSTFQRTDEECLRLSTFFSACRILSTTIKGLIIRTSVRSNVWASIRATDEALDKCEQYILDIRWSRTGTRSILAKRISHYIKRKAEESLSDLKSKQVADYIDILKDDDILNFIFPQQFGVKNIGAYNVIHLFSAGRPRWALQLCKLAAKEVAKSSPNKKTIPFGCVRQILKQYGRYRIDDIIREHSHQCKQIEEIIHSFAGRKSNYTTEKLIEFLRLNIIPNCTSIFIDNNGPIKEPLQIANFLFRCGFITARHDIDDQTHTFYSYEEKSYLLRVHSNIDEGFTWSVHPSFWDTLNIEGIK